MTINLYRDTFTWLPYVFARRITTPEGQRYFGHRWFVEVYWLCFCLSIVRTA